MGRIIDPFAGCGTTLVEANSLEVASVGFEPHPFLADICRTKLLVGLSAEPVKAVQKLLETSEPLPFAGSPSAEQFLRKLIPAASLALLCGARVRTEALDGDQRLLAFLILSRVLDLCSHSKTDGIYKAPTSRKAPISYIDAIRHVCDQVEDDLKWASARHLRNKAVLVQDTSENMGGIEPASCSLLITSPPYLNNFDFAEMTRMHLYFWAYASDWNEITEKVRAKLIVNTTTALRGHKSQIAEYRKETPETVRDELDGYQQLLRERRATKAGKKEYDFLIYPYFAQVTRVLSSARTTLCRKAGIRIIVADAALYGMHIRTHLIFARLLVALGYENVSLRLLRKRGTRWILEKREGTADGLGEYEIAASAP